MSTSNIVSRSSFSGNTQKIESVVVILSYYFELIKEENRDRCSHMLATN